MAGRIILNRNHETQVNSGKTFQLGGEGAVAGVTVVDFDSDNDTLYGFYTMRDIEITAVEHIVIEEHACSTQAGIVEITDGTTAYATVTAVDEAAVHTHISGVVGSSPKIPKGTYVYAKTTTPSTDASAVGGEGYFIVEYK